MSSNRVEFKNGRGQKLAGRLEMPIGEDAVHYAVFAHCFTCGKDLKAASNIALALRQEGVAVLRFDFTGLGQSDGDFSKTDFSSNLEDLQAACAYLTENYRAPELLIGHSLGGTAAIMAAAQMDNIKAVATIGAPSDPEHVLGLLQDDIDTIEKEGSARVSLAGRPFTIRKQFVEDLRAQGLKPAMKKLRGRSILILHSPQDRTVEIKNARELYEMAHHPKSFISLDGADHLMSDKEDSLYAGRVIANWVHRYLPGIESGAAALETDEQVVANLEKGPFLTRILAGVHPMLADEPEKMGGGNRGPSPYDLVASGLGACTAMTIKMYADRKEWPLDEVEVHLSYDGKYTEDRENCEEDERKIGKFTRLIRIEGDLDDKQRKRLLEIANKCPVHKTLSAGSSVETKVLET